MTLVVAVNYGSRQEMMNAAQAYADAAIAAHEKGEELVLTEELFEQGLDTADT